jgi:hypothetical protein
LAKVSSSLAKDEINHGTCLEVKAVKSFERFLLTLKELASLSHIHAVRVQICPLRWASIKEVTESK